MIGFKAVGKSSPIYFVIFAVDYLGSVIVKHDHSVKDIARNLLNATSHSTVNFPVQVNFFCMSKSLHFLLLFVF